MYLGWQLLDGVRMDRGDDAAGIPQKALRGDTFSTAPILRGHVLIVPSMFTHHHQEPESQQVALYLKFFCYNDTS